MIKLITVIGHGTNLLPHFINHYQNYVDEINVAVYVTDKYYRIEEQVDKILADFPFVNKVITVRDRLYDWDKVTSLYNFVKTKFQNDWWVVADIDEFHLYPNDNLKRMVSDCEENGWQIVRGGFIDRIGPDGNFPSILPALSIWQQFPNAGFFRYPMSNACPNKICVVKGYVEITSGQHYAKINGQTTWRWQGWNHPLIAPIETHSVQVHHFKWDSSSIKRIKSVADLKQDYSYSTEYELMYNELKKTKFKINVTKEEFHFELGMTQPEYQGYRNWNKLIKQIISI